MSASGLRITLPARAANLIVVRQAIAGVGEAVGLSPHRVNDLKAVVTEACNNVVLYAYEGEGPMEISAAVAGEHVEVSVSDRGRGFRPRPALDQEPSLGLGLPLVAALADSWEIHGAAGEGTTMVMRFGLREQAPGGANGSSEQPRAAEGPAIRISAGAEVRPVLARVIGALAARADFSIDRLSDTFLLGDAVSAGRAEDFSGGRVEVAISDGEGCLDVCVGPLVEGGGDRMLARMEIPAGGSLRDLASSMGVRRDTAADGTVTEFLEFGVER